MNACFGHGTSYDNLEIWVNGCQCGWIRDYVVFDPFVHVKNVAVITQKMAWNYFFTSFWNTYKRLRDQYTWNESRTYYSQFL